MGRYELLTAELEAST